MNTKKIIRNLEIIEDVLGTINNLPIECKAYIKEAWDAVSAIYSELPEIEEEKEVKMKPFNEVMKNKFDCRVDVLTAIWERESSYKEDIADLLVFLQDYTSPVGAMHYLMALYGFDLKDAKTAWWENKPAAEAKQSRFKLIP